MVAHPPCDGSSVANEASKGAKISTSDIALKYNVKTIKCRNLVQHTPAAYEKKLIIGDLFSVTLCCQNVFTSFGASESTIKTLQLARSFASDSTIFFGEVIQLLRYQIDSHVQGRN